MRHSGYVREEEKHRKRFRLYAVVDHAFVREEELLLLVVVLDPYGFIECSIPFSTYGDVVHSSEADEGLEEERCVVGLGCARQQMEKALPRDGWSWMNAAHCDNRRIVHDFVTDLQT